MIKTKPFVIAEIGNNHEGKLSVAKRLVLSAKKAGVDAVKIQIIKPEKFFHSSNKLAIKKYSKFLLSKKEYLELYKFAKKIKVDLFSTFFDLETAKFFAKKQRLFKIASCDNNNFDFINFFLKYDKPTFISLGLLNIKGIFKLYKFLSSKKNKRYLKNITLLHCVSDYPTSNHEINLNSIKFLKKQFPKIRIGFSDHTIGPEACYYASILGAEVIEKHFTLNKNFSNFRDHSLSADFKEMKNIIKFIENSKKYLGIEAKIVTKNEYVNYHIFRRHPFYNKDLKKNSYVKLSDVDFLRTSKKNNYKQILNFQNKKIFKNVKLGDLVKKSHFEK